MFRNGAVLKGAWGRESGTWWPRGKSLFRLICPLRSSHHVVRLKQVHRERDLVLYLPAQIPVSPCILLGHSVAVLELNIASERIPSMFLLLLLLEIQIWHLCGKV